MENTKNTENKELPGKRVADSYTENVQILLQSTMNGYNRLYGGKLLEWIDMLAAVVARRHCGMNVTTAAIDNLQFKEPAYLNDIIIMSGRITYTGNTSMEIRVDTVAESLDGTRRLINRAYLVIVAIDENGHPVKIPPLIIETEEERAEYEAAKKRREYRQKRRLENF